MKNKRRRFFFVFLLLRPDVEMKCVASAEGELFNACGDFMTNSTNFQLKASFLLRRMWRVITRVWCCAEVVRILKAEKLNRTGPARQGEYHDKPHVCNWRLLNFQLHQWLRRPELFIILLRLRVDADEQWISKWHVSRLSSMKTWSSSFYVKDCGCLRTSN